MAFPSFPSEAHAKAFLEEVCIAQRLAAETPPELQRALQARADQLTQGMADIRDVDGRVDDEVRVGISNSFGAQVHGALQLLKSGADLSLGIVGELNPDGSPLKTTATLYDLSQKTITLQQDLQTGNGAATVSDGLKLLGKIPGAGQVGALGAQAAAMRAVDEGQPEAAVRESAEAAGKLSGGFFGKTVSLASTAYKAAKGFWNGGSEIVESQQYKGDLQQQGDNIHAQNEQHLAHLSERHEEVIAPLSRMALPNVALTQQFIAQAHAQYPHLADPTQLDQDRIASGLQEQKALVAEQVRHTADPVAQARLQEYLLDSAPAAGQLASAPAESPETMQSTHELALDPHETAEPAEPIRTVPEVTDAPVSDLPDASLATAAPDSSPLAEYSAAPLPADESEEATHELQPAAYEPLTEDYLATEPQAADWLDASDERPAQFSESAEPTEGSYPTDGWGNAEQYSLTGYESEELPTTPDADPDAAPAFADYTAELATNASADADDAAGYPEALSQPYTYLAAEEAPAELETAPMETAVSEFPEITAAADEWSTDTPDAALYPLESAEEQEAAAQQPPATDEATADELAAEEAAAEQEVAEEAVTDEIATDEEPAQAADELTEPEEVPAQEADEPTAESEEEPAQAATDEALGEEPELVADEAATVESDSEQEPVNESASDKLTAPEALADEPIADRPVPEESDPEEVLPSGESVAPEALAAASTAPVSTAAAAQPAASATASAASTPAPVANGSPDGQGAGAAGAQAAAAGSASASRRDGTSGAAVSPPGYLAPGPTTSASCPDTAAATAAAASANAALAAPAGGEAWPLQEAIAMTLPDSTTLLTHTDEEEAAADAVFSPAAEAEPVGAGAESAGYGEPDAGYQQGYEPDAADSAERAETPEPTAESPTSAAYPEAAAAPDTLDAADLAEGYTSYESDTAEADSFSPDAAADAVATAYNSDADDAEESPGPADAADSNYDSSYLTSSYSASHDPGPDYVSNLYSTGSDDTPSLDVSTDYTNTSDDDTSSNELSSAYAASDTMDSENYLSSYSEGATTADDTSNDNSAYAESSDATGSPYPDYDSSTHADYAGTDDPTGSEYAHSNELEETREAESYDSGSANSSDASLDSDPAQSDSSGSSNSASVTAQ